MIGDGGMNGTMDLGVTDGCSELGGTTCSYSMSGFHVIEVFLSGRQEYSTRNAGSR